MDDVVGATMSTPRFTGFLLSIFAALALSLSAIGIYGVLSYLVSRRTREIGIRSRSAPAARRSSAWCSAAGCSLALAGVIAGLARRVRRHALLRAAAARGRRRRIRSTFAAVAIVLSLVAVLASVVPAWRASRVDPVIALKAE